MSVISVILPIYNAGPPLREAIESILTQTHRNLELLLLDDASTDGSASLIEEFARRDSRVRAIHHATNHGLSATLNEGLAAARGALVARMDQDDIALPARLAVQADYLNRTPRVAVVGSWVYNLGLTPAHDRLVRLPFSPAQVAECLPQANCLYHPTTMFRREIVLAAGGYRGDFRNAEDYELWLRLSRAHLLANIPRPLLRYRLSAGGMTIGRKWEQLRYVFIAQESHRTPEIAWAEIVARAEERLGQQNRQKYFDHVVEDVCRRLAQLGFRDDALTLSKKMRSEMSSEAAARLDVELAVATTSTS